MKKVKILSLMLAVAMFACLLIPAMSANAATAHVYYVSATGDDSNDGLSEANAKKSLLSAIKEAEKLTLVDGDTVTIKISGAVGEAADSSGNPSYSAQQLLSSGRNGGENLDDANGKLIPLILEGVTADAKVIFAHKGDDTASTRRYVMNDITFKNLTLSVVRASSATSDANLFYLYASTGALRFDNVKFDNSVTWRVCADNFTVTPSNNLITYFKSTEAAPLKVNGTLSFKNGDYTNLDWVAAVGSRAALTTYSAKAEINSTLIIGEGAKMGTVHVVKQDTNMKSTTVEVKSGAEIAKLVMIEDELKMTKAVDVTVTIEQGANVTRLVETGVGSTVMGTVTLNKPNASTPSTPATADASEIVLFSFVAMVSLAGVVMVKKASAR